jgi:hypothetical protein
MSRFFQNSSESESENESEDEISVPQKPAK